MTNDNIHVILYDFDDFLALWYNGYKTVKDVNALFKIGDKVFYPNHGAGIIKDIETKEVLGKEQEYYIISIPNMNMNIMVPKKNAEKIGLRHVVDRTTLKNAIKNARTNKECLELPWKDRYKININKLKTGELIETVEAYYDLALRSKEKTLNASEKQLLTKAQKYLISEICIVEEISESEAEKYLVV